MPASRLTWYPAPRLPPNDGSRCREDRDMGKRQGFRQVPPNALHHEDGDCLGPLIPTPKGSHNADYLGYPLSTRRLSTDRRGLPGEGSPRSAAQ